ncbi:MAG TPA: pyridoxamine 5'-phosphate oxidase family protein [Mycobacteriales bacterium]|nr:pyridoxamine 5'-phosphate oxidase family protein [Mycobacteriales bacterium]
MHETGSDLEHLQSLLDASVGRASEHLTSIVTPDHRLTASELCSVLTGMCTLALSTVTAAGEPRVSGVDGHFLRGRWLFTTSGTAVKVRHLRARPACSVAHLRGDDLGVFVHGQASLMAPVEVPGWVEEHLVAHYGSSPTTWGPDIVYAWVDPAWVVAYAFQKEKLLGAGSA